MIANGRTQTANEYSSRLCCRQKQQYSCLKWKENNFEIKQSKKELKLFLFKNKNKKFKEIKQKSICALAYKAQTKHHKAYKNRRLHRRLLYRQQRQRFSYIYYKLIYIIYSKSYSYRVVFVPGASFYEKSTNIANILISQHILFTIY